MDTRRVSISEACTVIGSSNRHGIEPAARHRYRSGHKTGFVPLRPRPFFPTSGIYVDESKSARASYPLSLSRVRPGRARRFHRPRVSGLGLAALRPGSPSTEPFPRVEPAAFRRAPMRLPGPAPRGVMPDAASPLLRPSRQSGDPSGRTPGCSWH